jgi:FkbM family methyltransferase
MTAVLAERARIVHSFEPHPRLFAELSENVRSFQQQGSSASIELHNEAVGEKDGVLPLSIPADFERHRGESSLLPRDGAGATTVHVQVTTLDRLFAPPTSIGVMKLDVEGFEKQVFLGAGELLKSHRIRDCVFEELRPYPTDVIAILESYGYTLYRLARGLARPRLLPGDSGEARSIWEATSFLATSQPRRALDRMGRFGWRTLGR